MNVILHAPRDRSVAVRLASTLSDLGLQVWAEHWEGHRGSPESSASQKLEEADAVLWIASPSSTRSSRVLSLVRQAIGAGKPVVAVETRGGILPKALAELHATRWSGRRRERTLRLLRELCAAHSDRLPEDRRQVGVAITSADLISSRDVIFGHLRRMGLESGSAERWRDEFDVLILLVGRGHQAEQGEKAFTRAEQIGAPILAFRKRYPLFAAPRDRQKKTIYSNLLDKIQNPEKLYLQGGFDDMEDLEPLVLARLVGVLAALAQGRKVRQEYAREFALRLRLRAEGLEVYLTHADISWGQLDEYRYRPQRGAHGIRYEPPRISMRNSTPFKHFVVCAVEERQEVTRLLEESGFEVTGSGDAAGEGRWRLWFLIPGLPTVGLGVFRNNLWTEEYARSLAPFDNQISVPIKIFLSYSHRDKTTVRRIDRALTREGLTTWLDMKDIHVGDTIREEVERGIEECDFYCPCISQSFLDSSWARTELEMALKRQLDDDRKWVLPVVMGDVDLPLQVSTIRHANCAEDFDLGMTDLLDGIRHLAHVRRRERAERRGR